MNWTSTNNMPVYIGGAELNVARALALWQHEVKYVTALPPHFVADDILASLAAEGIDTSQVKRCGDRIGLYYLPPDSDVKSAAVVYDRAQSSFAMLAPGSIDWEAALDGCDWLHLSAISPALQRNVFEVCLEAVTAASKKGIHISIDLNYRSRLWQYGVSPASIMPELVAHCDVVMGNLWAADQLLGIPSTIENSEGKSNDELIRAAEKSMQALQSAFPKAKHIAYTFRLMQQYFAVLYHDGMVVSPIFALDKVVDKVGSGDCFMAGLIHGIRQQYSDSNIISFATAAAVNKMGESGDSTRSDLSVIMKQLEHVK